MLAVYKALNSAAEVPPPNFALTLHVPYDSNLALRLQESWQDCNCHILPLVLSHKLYEVGIIHGQKNVPWQTLLDLLYLHQFTLVDWPAGVSAVGTDFNVKCLNADELCALVVPFLKEQMGVDYMLEAPEDDDDVADEGLVPMPESSFYLMDWTPGIFVLVQHNVLELTSQPEQLELFRDADPKMFDIPLVINTCDQLLHLLSDSQAFLKGLPKGMNDCPVDSASISVAFPLPSSLPPPSSPSLLLSSPPPPSSPPRGFVNSHGVSHLPVMCQDTWVLSQPLTDVTEPASCQIPQSLNNCEYPESPGNIKQNLRKKHLYHREEHIMVVLSMLIKDIHIRDVMNMTVMRMVTMHGIGLAGNKYTQCQYEVLSYVEVPHWSYPIITSLYPAVHNQLIVMSMVLAVSIAFTFATAMNVA
ncbi:hypothetical protein EV401DRAFT_1895069 [Pisolithus croceorrhizus]|nr:hypothetical protein EV401DRAFT_1895069 [Pisolithus croceorrhizus]